MANDSYGTFFSETRVPYDPLGEGPLKKQRHSTNRFWLFGLILFTIAWVIVAIYAFVNGDIQRLIVPTDSEGRKCGLDLDVQDKPYLIFFDLTKCANGTCDTTQVCHASCPTDNFLYQNNAGSLEDVKKKLICQIDINVELITSWTQLDYYMNQNKCARWYLRSESIIDRCIPKLPVPVEFNSTISNDQLNNATQTILQIANIEKQLEYIYHDFLVTRYTVLGFVVLSGVAAFFYIILLRWLAKPFVYTSILIICAFLVYFIYESSLQYTVNNSSNWLYVLIFCIISLIVVVLATIFLHQRIDLACQIIKESSKAVTNIWSSLLFPVLPWILHLLVVALAAAVFLYLQTITVPHYQVHVQDIVENSCQCPSQLDYVNNATCNPEIFKIECRDVNGGPCVTANCYLSGTTTPGLVYIYQIINAFGFLWFSFFISSFGHIVLAMTFATWYWAYNKRNIPSFTLIRSSWITFRYHLGTLAFGSLIMWICDIVRVILKPITGITQSSGPLHVQSGGCIKFVFDILLSYLQYINRNAYTMCAIHGRGFCHSAKDAFNLITRNIVRVVVITNVTDWLLRIAKYFIIVLTVGLTMVYYKNKGPEVISGIEVPVIIAFIGSYLITSVFFKVHKAAVDTLFLCFLQDSERSYTSNDEPYYMSTKLKQLLEK